VKKARLHRRSAILTLATAVSVLALTGVASARKSATPSQVAALTRAVHTSVVGGAGTVPTDRYNVTGVKISTVSKSWATASLVPTSRFKDTFQSAYVMAVKLAGTGTWVVVDLGSAEVGCGVVPNSVLADLLALKKGEQPCPPGEGVS
jgi:hypothetical protein